MKTIFFKLLLILFILLAIILLYQPTKEKDSLYKGKENEDVYVSVKVGDNTQKILLDDYLLGVVAGEMPASFELSLYILHNDHSMKPSSFHHLDKLVYWLYYLHLINVNKQKFDLRQLVL